ncbi:MAG: DNA-binding protein [Dehalococcoidia bacterium]|nr:DNA-binding protein [Dehalococcoidia bacterium]
MLAPAPSPDGLGKEFWDAVRRHELVVQRCNDCKQYQWGPEYICYHCHSFNLGYQKVSGRGRLYTWERVWHPLHEKVADRVPYIIAIVELPDAGNVRMVGNLVGDPLQQVRIGSEVEVVFEDHATADPYTLVQWRQL